MNSSTSVDRFKKNLRPISDKCLIAGVIGILIVANLPFLPEAVRSAVHWVSVSLIAFSVVVTITLVVKELKRMRAGGAFRTGKLSKTSRKAKGTAKKEFPAALYILSILVVVLGLSFIFLVPQGYQSYRFQSQASDWPQTMGEVVSAEIVVDERGAGLDDDMVQPKVVTRYEVNGRKYTTREITFNQSLSWSTSYGYANAMTSKYPPGTNVQVYYNPEQPSVAVLETSTDWFTFLIMGLGALLVVLGIYWFWLSLRDTYFFIANLLGKSVD